MRVLVPFTFINERHRESIRRFAPQAELVDVSGDDLDYSCVVSQLWRDGDDFAIVEHDIEIHATVMSEFALCPEPWCVFLYDHGPDGYGVLMPAFGCVRFRKELLRAQPEIAAIRSSWECYDSEVKCALIAAGYSQHVHHPPVLHHHVWNEVCACGTEH
jgi:hypothetical protein